MKINAETVSILLTQEKLSLSASKVLMLVCTIIRTVKFYAWTIYLSRILIDLS